MNETLTRNNSTQSLKSIHYLIATTQYGRSEMCALPTTSAARRSEFATLICEFADLISGFAVKCEIPQIILRKLCSSNSEICNSNFGFCCSNSEFHSFNLGIRKIVYWYFFFIFHITVCNTNDWYLPKN